MQAMIRQIMAYKAAHDPEPTPPPPSPQEQEGLAAKEQQAQEWLAQHPELTNASRNAAEGSVASSVPCADFDGSGNVRIGDILYVVKSFGTSNAHGSLDQSADLISDGAVTIGDILAAVNQYGTDCNRGGITTINRNYKGQEDPNWCGPAAVSEALDIKGVSLNQTGAAWLLETDQSGTGWGYWNLGYATVPPEYDTSHPIRDVMNYATGTHFYYPVPPSPNVGLGSSNPTLQEIAAVVTDYNAKMMADIGQHWGVLGDAYELTGDQNPHLWGHPTDHDIGHWFTISGYEAGGSRTNYMDSATTVWPNRAPDWDGVPGWTTNFDTTALVVILWPRGYIW
jgi:hypothetical protein